MNSVLPSPVPLDVRLMNLVASLLYAGCAVALLAALVGWAFRHPWFALTGITVRGDTTHNNVVTLRANVAPRLVGNFFTIDLAHVRAAFEAVPWVREALVRREFPNRLQVVLREYRPVAYWGDTGDAGDAGESRLLDEAGRVFDANVDELDDTTLPRLAGPREEAPRVLAMYHALLPALAPLGLRIERLDLSAHGGWRVRFGSGAVVELGRGTPEEVVVRARDFARTLTQVAAKYGRRTDALESADLRHASGYALRLRGVSTTVAAASRK